MKNEIHKIYKVWIEPSKRQKWNFVIKMRWPGVHSYVWSDENLKPYEFPDASEAMRRGYAAFPRIMNEYHHKHTRGDVLFSARQEAEKLFRKASIND